MDAAALERGVKTALQRGFKAVVKFVANRARGLRALHVSYQALRFIFTLTDKRVCTNLKSLEEELGPSSVEAINEALMDYQRRISGVWQGVAASKGRGHIVPAVQHCASPTTTSSDLGGGIPVLEAGGVALVTVTNRFAMLAEFEQFVRRSSAASALDKEGAAALDDIVPCLPAATESTHGRRSSMHSVTTTDDATTDGSAAVSRSTSTGSLTASDTASAAPSRRGSRSYGASGKGVESGLADMVLFKFSQIRLDPALKRESHEWVAEIIEQADRVLKLDTKPLLTTQRRLEAIVSRINHIKCAPQTPAVFGAAPTAATVPARCRHPSD